jgi:hypothetical protein
MAPHLNSPAVRKIGINILSHTVLHARKAMSEGVAILTNDAAAEAAKLSSRLKEADSDGRSHVAIWAGSMDGVCPVGPMYRKLEAAGFPMQDFYEEPGMNHGDPITDPSYFDRLEKALVLELEHGKYPDQTSTQNMFKSRLAKLRTTRRYTPVAS